MPDNPTDMANRTYILRVWQERSAGQGRAAVWRFSLVDVMNRHSYVFANLNNLTSYLREAIETDTSEQHMRIKPDP